MRTSGARSIRSPRKTGCPPRAWPSAPGSTRRPSIRRSAACRTGAPAGRAPKAWPRCWTPPAPAWRRSPRWCPAPARWPAMVPPATPARRVPLIGLAQAGGDGFFDDGGYPVGGGWDEVSLPEIADPNAYALEISGDSMEPVFRDGDMVIVSPSAPIRRGDRVVVRTQRGRGDGQAARPPLRPPRRAAKPQPGASRLQLRPDRGRLDAPHHLGQPVARRRRICSDALPPGRFRGPAGMHACGFLESSAMRPRFSGCSPPVFALRVRRRAPRRAWISRWCWSPTSRAASTIQRVQAGEGRLCGRLHQRRQVLDAIQGGTVGAIAVAYVEFASSFEVRTVLDWSVIRDEASAQAFADKLVGRAALVLGPHRDQRRRRPRRAVAGRERLRRAAPGDRRVRRRHQQRRPRGHRGARRRGEGRHHHQRPGDHQRPSGVLDLSRMCSRRAGCRTTIGRMSLAAPAASCWRCTTSTRFGEAMTRKLVTEIAERATPRHLAALHRDRRLAGAPGVWPDRRRRGTTWAC